MKLFVILLLIILLILIVLPLVRQDDVSVVGRIKVNSIDITSNLYGVLTSNCDCCAPLWGGGQAIALSDLSGISLYDTAHLILLGGQRLVVECVEITPCIRVRHWFVSWNGIIKDNGDVLIFSNGMVYRWIIL